MNIAGAVHLEGRQVAIGQAPKTISLR